MKVAGHYTGEAIREILSLRAEGLSYGKIAAKFGTTKGAIGALVLRAERGQKPASVVDLEARRAEIIQLYLQDVTVREIGRRMGVSLDAISRRLRSWKVPARQVASLKGSRIPFVGPKPRSDAPPAIGPIGDFPASGACRYIAGLPDKHFQCCGQPGYPFCDYHTALCYDKRRVTPAPKPIAMAAE